jgi:hypothetical protein
VDEFKEPVAQFKFMSPSVKNNNEFLETPEIAFNRIEDRQGQLNLHLTTVIDPAGDPAHTGFFVEPGAMAFLFDAAYYLESEQLYDLPEEVFVVGDFSNWQRSEDFALEEIEEASGSPILISKILNRGCSLSFRLIITMIRIFGWSHRLLQKRLSERSGYPKPRALVLDARSALWF